MRPIVTDGFASVCLSVCQSVIILSPAKRAELIKMPFGLWTRVGQRNHVLDGFQIPLFKWTILCGEHYVHGKWLAERVRTKILLQSNRSFGETPDQVISGQETVKK